MTLTKLAILICGLVLAQNTFAFGGSCVPFEGRQGESCRKMKDERACKSDSECTWVRPLKAQKIKIQGSSEEQPTRNENSSDQ